MADESQEVIKPRKRREAGARPAPAMDPKDAAAVDEGKNAGGEGGGSEEFNKLLFKELNQKATDGDQVMEREDIGLDDLLAQKNAGGGPATTGAAKKNIQLEL